MARYDKDTLARIEFICAIIVALCLVAFSVTGVVWLISTYDWTGCTP
jgi:hypothetical protein